jgi:anaerobic magnesium-protoporphyrin IX monomethyl ester cyclase
MKVLLTHSYFLRLDPKQWATGRPYAPLGTLYAAAVLKERGYNLSFFDTMFSKGPEDLIAVIQSERPDIFIIYDDGFNYLTKMCLVNMREAAFEMIRLASQQGCTVIISSSDSTDRYEMYLNRGASFILMGEAEQTLGELMYKLENVSGDYLSVEGIAFTGNDGVVKTRPRQVLKNLDSLPFPAWEMIDMEPYRKSWLKHTGYFSMNMATTRGCPFKCNWCAKPIYGNRYNSRSPGNVISELKMLKRDFGFDHIWFCDDIFGLKPGWVGEFASLAEEENLKIKFKMQGRVDLLLQENYIGDLARAGCENIWMGAESGSQRILDAMDKGTTVQQISAATRLLKKYGIRPSFFIQFGYLTETKEDIQKTIHMINELLPYEIGISVSYPLPGTVFFEKVKMELIHKTNWKDSDEMALMFGNTYKPAFYKRLHRYVHKSYRKHLAFEGVKMILSHPFRLNYDRLKRALSALYYIPAAFLDKQKLNFLENTKHGY